MIDYYGKDAVRLKNKKLFLFDMDGTIYLGENLFEGVPELLKKIEENGLWRQKEKRIPDWGAAWGGDELFGTLEFQAIHKQTDEILELQIENGPTVQKTAKELYNLIFGFSSSSGS